jgi:nicotinate dehydrogenase subunit B
MGPVVSELATLPKSDVRAIAHYLSSLDGEPQALAANAAPQVDSPVSLSNGERVFKGACLACHSDGLGPKLFGVSPSMAVNSNVHSDLPDNLLRVVLHGIPTPATRDLGYMPGFKDSLSDRQVADLAAYLRHRFAADKPAWQGLASKAAQVRANPGSH